MPSMQFVMGKKCLFVGGQNYLGWSKEGPKTYILFIASKRGTRIFFLLPSRGQNYCFLSFPFQKFLYAFNAICYKFNINEGGQRFLATVRQQYKKCPVGWAKGEQDFFTCQRRGAHGDESMSWTVRSMSCNFQYNIVA